MLHLNSKLGQLKDALMTELHKLEAKVDFFKLRYNLEEKVSILSNDMGKVDSNFFCYAATVLSSHRNVLIFTQRIRKPT